MRILDKPVTKDELNSNLEAMLLDNGSQQNDLREINLYSFLMHPSQGNMSRGVGYVI